MVQFSVQTRNYLLYKVLFQLWGQPSFIFNVC